MSYPRLLNDRFLKLKCCVVIPTYNNEKTVKKVIEDALEYTDHILVINDGATDNTPTILNQFATKIKVFHQSVNMGKGMALRRAFKEADALGYEYVISIDSDGQHFPSDFHLFLNEIENKPGSLVIGARNLQSENVPGKSNFGNKFSNFWYKVETGISLADTQSGYRLYPISRMKKIKYFTNRFEFEIEVIVKAAWKRIPVYCIPIQVYYAKGEERISHFRPGKDFFRISLLNTYLVTLAFLIYRPLRLLRSLTWNNIKSFFKEHFLNPNESAAKKSASVGVGIFFGIIPIWGYQFISAVAAAYLLKLNKAIVMVTANISVPPMIPVILFVSVKTGEVFLNKKADFSLSNINLESVKTNLSLYLYGACILSVIAAVAFALISYPLFLILNNKTKVVK
jgi:glycosyltransferase involved in cell wall biosynthesis